MIRATWRISSSSRVSAGKPYRKQLAKCKLMSVYNYKVTAEFHEFPPIKQYKSHHYGGRNDKSNFLCVQIK